MTRSNDALRRVGSRSIDAFAIVGSDKVNEYGSEELQSEVLEPIPDLRFAIASERQRITEVRSMIAANEALCIGTSYPRTAIEILGSVGLTISMDDIVAACGCVESLPLQPDLQVDAIVELAQSGDSLQQNGLAVVIDNLQSVDLVKVTKK